MHSWTNPLRGESTAHDLNVAKNDSKVILQRLEDHVESAFGLVKSTKSATLPDIDEAISQARAQRGRR